MKVNLITDILHNQMRKEDIGLVLLTTRVIQHTLKILTHETNQIITRSAVRSATKTSFYLEIELIKEYQVFKDYGKLFMRKIRLVILARDIKRSEYILSLMSNIVENSKQDL